MTAAEIVKGARICVHNGGTCKECPFYNTREGGQDCCDRLLTAAADLIEQRIINNPDRTKKAENLVTLLSECFRESGSIEELAEKLTAADIAPVVRCKDCKHFRVWKDCSPTCEHWTYVDDVSTDANAFCSYGERREE